ncbi:hypothetical protein ACIGDI_10495 [Streptomyces sp. NPDC085900]|uniref:hypothetical protein n=1 Tax=Streptomyces sp. NPDC085900 TaxID=3365737 RepID=UPI0037D335F0
MAWSRGVVNRAVLGVLGLVLLGAGLWLVGGDLGVASRLPSWWPADGTGSVLMDRAGLARLRGAGWWTPVVMTAASLLTVLFVYWALAQIHSGRTRPLALPSPGATVHPHTLAGALSARVAQLPGVARCRARVLPRGGTHLDVGLRVWLEPGTPPDAVLPGLTALAAEAENAAAPCTTRTRIRLSGTSHRTPHVR